MARYNHLPIYRDSYSLLIDIMELTKNFPKEYKFSIGEKLQNHALELIVAIYKANNEKDKCPFIAEILEHIQFIGLFLRVAFDVKIINELRFTDFVEKVGSIDKQAGAWMRFASGTAQTLEV